MLRRDYARELLGNTSYNRSMNLYRGDDRTPGWRGLRRVE